MYLSVPAPRAAAMHHFEISRPTPRIAQILNRATLIYDVAPAEVTNSALRHTELSECRSLIVRAVRLLRPDMSYARMGRHLGMDHSSVIVAERRAIRLYTVSPEFADALDEVMAYFSQGAGSWA